MEYPHQRALALARSGQHAASAADAVTVANQPNIPAVTLFDLACALALSSAGAATDEHLAPTERTLQANRFAGRAVELLARARDAGFFNDPAGMKRLRDDKELDALRTRSDFQKLRNGLARKAPSPTDC